MIFSRGQRGRISKIRLQWLSFSRKTEPDPFPGFMHGQGTGNSCTGFSKNRENLQLYPEEEQHYAGHSKRGKYNSAYSIGFVVVNNLSAIDDTRWKGVAGQTAPLVVWGAQVTQPGRLSRAPGGRVGLRLPGVAPVRAGGGEWRCDVVQQWGPLLVTGIIPRGRIFRETKSSPSTVQPGYAVHLDEVVKIWSGQVGSLEFGPGERVVLPPRGRVTIENRTLQSEQITTST
ncbi:hypothetical protein TIFTF001_021620 [Ficus carica]|uniref:Uncharacterized protein n=1 Tax=Ficus carica TaxID=3494 RepID=A0AA88AYY4_FICCA|nr:hypothetical protein TIFTF001_021620 [Ficus carica]